jgi:large repetitive protein
MMNKLFLFNLVFLPLFVFGQNESLNIQIKNYSEPYNICKSDPVTLEVSPKVDSLTYQWFKNGQAYISGPGSITLFEGGSYSVSAKSGNVQLNSNSVFIQNCRPAIPETEKNKAQNTTLAVFPTVSSANPVICGSNTSAILQASPVNATYTYQWYFSTTEFGSYTILTGAISATYTTSVIGYYKVLVGDGSPPNLSSAIFVSDKPYATLTDITGNLYNDINLINGAAQLKINFYGLGPFIITLSDGPTYKSISSSSNSYIASVSPNQNKYYSIFSLYSLACGNGFTSGGHKIIVDPTTGFTLPTPQNLNICAGGTINIPYTEIGSWLPERSLGINLINATTNISVSNASQFSNSQNPIQFQLPSILDLNADYKVQVYGRFPFTNVVQSSYSFTVTSVGCTPTKPVILGNNIGCGYSDLYSNLNNFNGSLIYNFQWFKNGVLIPNSNNSSLRVLETATYTLNVQNQTGSFNVSSDPILVNITGSKPIITSVNPVICGSNVEAILNSSLSDPLFNYQWYIYEQFGGYRVPVFGQNNPILNTKIVGDYILEVSNSQCSIESNSFKVSNTSSVKLTDNLNNTNIDINAGESVDLKLSFTGLGPWNFDIYDGVNTFNYISNSNPHFLSLTPAQSTQYSVSNLNNACGSSNTSNKVQINVLPAPTFSIGSPTVNTFCIGSLIELPYTISGNWTSDRAVSISLVNTTNNSSYTLTNIFIGNNTLKAIVGQGLPLGTYKIFVSFSKPYIFNTFLSSYLITLNNTNCIIPNATITNFYFSNSCQSSALNAYPQGSGYTFQWFKNDLPISGASANNYYTDGNGNYKVLITNPVLNYTSTSDIFIQNGPASIAINYLNSVGNICSGSGTMTLVSPNTNPYLTYQWYYAASDFGYQAIQGAVQNTYNATLPGFYYLIIKNGTCEIKTYPIFTCQLLLKFASKSVCKGSNIIVPFNKFGQSANTLYTLDLVEESTSNIVYSNLSTIDNSVQSFNFNLPASILPGNYRFRVRSTSPTYTSPESSGILTVSNIAAGTAPIITSNILTFSSPQPINLNATGCSGILDWTIPNSSLYSGSVYNGTVRQTTTYSVLCRDVALTCVSPSASITINYDCVDPLEPNNNVNTATPITTTSYLSTSLCLDSSPNEDYFSYVLNGLPYFIRVFLNSGSFGSPGKYVLKVGLNNGNLIIETLPTLNSPSFTHTILLYNVQGSFVASGSTQANGFQKITYLIPSPCYSLITLSSTFFDIGPGIVSGPRAVLINASNKISNTAIVNYRGQNAITLNPGFETQITTSGVFKAQIKGCNDNTD